MQAGVVDRLPEPGDERDEHLLQAGEDHLDLGGLHARLVVVEEDVVRIVVRLVARDVLARSSSRRSRCGRKSS